MSRKKFRAFMSFILIIALCVVGYLVGYMVTGNFNPLKWGSLSDTEYKQDNDETSNINTIQTVSVKANMRSISNETDEDSGIMPLAGETVVVTSGGGTFTATVVNVYSIDTSVSGVTIPCRLLKDSYGYYYVGTESLAIPSGYTFGGFDYITKPSGTNSWAKNTANLFYNTSSLNTAVSDLLYLKANLNINVSSSNSYPVIGIYPLNTNISGETVDCKICYDGTYYYVCSAGLMNYPDDYTFNRFAYTGAKWSAYNSTILTSNAVNIPADLSAITVYFDYPTKPLPEEPVKDGYHFVGWYYDAAFTRPYDGEPIKLDTELYAKMEKNVYIVTFDTNCSQSLAPILVDYTNPVDTPTLSRIGYNFLGWYTADGVQYNGQGVTSDMMLFAHWEAQKFTVTFYVDDVQYTQIEVEYGSVLAAVSNDLYLIALSAYTADGEAVALDGAIVMQDILVYAEHMSAPETALTYIQNNWICFVACSICVIVGGIALGAIIKKR